MPLLNREHPQVDSFKTRGSAIALIRRTLKRALTSQELQQFVGNILLKDVKPDSPVNDRTSLLETLEADQLVNATELEKLSMESLGEEAVKSNAALEDAAKKLHGEALHDTLVAKRAEIDKKIADLQAECSLVVAELHRRDRIMETLKRFKGISTADAAEVLQTLTAGGVKAKTKVGDASV